ncbi:MAG: hypothetical protein HZB21_01390 [Deltaproteobacteria bacterium]|nr:hypothetical protein [Deltaproteobacteria bacterium]MBI5809833.1 hypothetical protein [Deltaproteobacteria bacterium]
MIASSIRLASGAALFVLSGFIVLRFIDKERTLGPGIFVRGAVSFMLGLGLVSQQMFLYSLLSIRFSFFHIAAPWAAAYLAGIFAPSFPPRGEAAGRRPRSAPVKKDSSLPSGIGVFEAILIFIIAVQVIYVFFFATTRSIRAEDAWAIWFLKAKVFFAEGSVPGDFLLDGYYSYDHPDYPLLIPLSIAWIYTVLGSAREMLAKVIYPLQFISMLFIFNYAVRKAADARTALLFTAFLSFTPLIVIHAGGLQKEIGGLYSGDFTGHADLALSVYFLSGGAFFYLYMLERKYAYLLLTAVFMAMGAWTKNEGLPFAAVGAVFIGLSQFRGCRAPIKVLASAAFLFLLFIAPWPAYKAHLGLKSEYAANLSLSTIGDNMERLVLVPRRMAGYMFGKTVFFNLTWWAYAASLLLNRRGSFRRPLLFLNALVFLQLAAYAFIYIISPAGIEWQLGTSLERLILHLVPLSMMITAINVHALLPGQAPGMSWKPDQP